MDDVERAIAAAWKQLRPRILANPRELARRFDRGRRALERPPRASCVALRAADHRLWQAVASRNVGHILHDAPDLPPGAAEMDWGRKTHTILLDRRILRRLCAPIVFRKGRRTLAQAAELLGVSRAGLLHARVAGTFVHHWVPGLGGRWGKPRPLIDTDDELDPATKGFAGPDPVWSSSARHLLDRIPRDWTEQLLYRVPRTVPRGWWPGDPAELHPEHPNHPDAEPPPPRRSLRLPGPPPDYVWYKWKGDRYVGYDWRNPAAAAAHARREKRLAKSRQARRLRPPTRERLARGSLEDHGWSWLCPRCGKRVNVVVMPLGLQEGLPISDCRLPNREGGGVSSGEFRVSNGKGLPISDCRLPNGEAVSSGVFRVPSEGGVTSGEFRVSNESGETPAAPSSQSEIGNRQSEIAQEQSPIAHPTFACERCHRVRRISRCDPNAWNDVICLLTGGLLYGREVERPGWFPRAKRAKAEGGRRKDETENAADRASAPSASSFSLHPSSLPPRKRSYRPRPNRAPSRRRPQVERLLLAGRTLRQTAARLGIAYGTVLGYAQRVYAQHGVRSLRALLAKHGKHVPPPPTHEVRRRLLAGQSIAQIASALGCGKTIIYNQRQALRKKGMKLADARGAVRLKAEG